LVDFLSASGGSVLEIGPGGGVLTRELLQAGATVMAWELDSAWGEELLRRCPSGDLKLGIGDALDIPWASLPVGTLVAGNLPYQISTKLIASIVEHPLRIPRAAFLVQKEVADRLAAAPGSKAYGALSVLMAARAQVRVLGRVRPGSFHPPPKVESAFVGLRLVQPPLEDEQMVSFMKMVRLAFSQRRKTLRNALASGWGRRAAERVIAAAELSPRVRAEALGLDAFLQLHDRARGILTAPF